MTIIKEILLKEIPCLTLNGASCPAALQLVKRKEDAGFYLLRLDEEGEIIADTFHLYIEDALRQAQFEFDVMLDEWRTVMQ